MVADVTGESSPLYTGKSQPMDMGTDGKGHRLSPYLPDPELVEAVNLSIFLGRPLLLKGEPGSGKTGLASAVAFELQLPYEPWYIKSTSRANDGLYIYDAISRIRDAQLIGTGAISGEAAKRSLSPATYLRYGPLGRAFRNRQRTVVLIDEIDKADIDFPNDLLLELDELRFFINETGEEIRANVPPIVFITSNDEKDLPDAFLRRCLFHYIRFPSYDRLVQIINAHFQDPSPEIVETAVTRFLELREEMRDRGDSAKLVSTSELIDWFRVLSRYPDDRAMSLLGGKLPYPSVLLKSWEDHLRYLEQDDAEEQ